MEPVTAFCWGILFGGAAALMGILIWLHNR